MLFFCYVTLLEKFLLCWVLGLCNHKFLAYCFTGRNAQISALKMQPNKILRSFPEAMKSECNEREKSFFFPMGTSTRDKLYADFMLGTLEIILLPHVTNLG